MADDKALRARVEAASRRRDDLALKVQRTLGRLEEAERALESINAECRAKNIDPEALSSVIATLETSLEASVEEYEARLNAAETALAPYLSRK
jgi:chromosome segregation ATPase